MRRGENFTTDSMSRGGCASQRRSESSEDEIIATEATTNVYRQASSPRNMSMSSRNSERKDKSKQINRSFLVAFVDYFIACPQARDQFESNIKDGGKFNLWLERVGEGNEVEEGDKQAIAILDLAKAKAARRKRELRDDQTSTAKSEHPHVRELGTGQIRQLQRAAFAMSLYIANDRRVNEMFRNSVLKHGVSVSFINAGSYFSLVIGGGSISGNSEEKDDLEMTVPTALEVILFFHCAVFFTRRKTNIVMSYVVGNRLGYLVQLVVKCWSRFVQCMTADTCSLLSALITPYIIYEEGTGLFRVLQSRSEGYSSAKQDTTVSNIKVTTEQSETSAAAWHRSDDVDRSMRYIVQTMFETLETLCVHPHLYTGGNSDVKNMSELAALEVPKNTKVVPEVFAEVPDSVLQTLGVERPKKRNVGGGGTSTNVIEISDDDSNDDDDDNGKVSAGGKRRNLELGEEDERGGQTNKMRKIVVKEENVIDTIVTSGIIKNEPIPDIITPAGKYVKSNTLQTCYNRINVEMIKEFYISETNFDQLEEAACDNVGVDINESVDLLLTDPPYNIRKEQNRSNSSYDSLTCEDMKSLIQVVSRMLKIGGHGIIFCSYLQFPSWYKMLRVPKEEVPDYNADADGNASKSVCKFEVEPKPLIYVREPGYYSSKPMRNNLTHVNVCECAIHFWRRGLTTQQQLSKVDYNRAQAFGSPYPSWSNVCTNIPRPDSNEIVYRKRNGDDYIDGDEEEEEDEDEGSIEGDMGERGSDNLARKSSGKGRRPMARAEQKSTKWMEELILKFSRKGDLVVDLCGGTLPVMKACMNVPQHRRFIGSEADFNLVATMEDRMIELFSRQLVNPKSDITTSDKTIEKAAKTIVAELERRKKSKRAEAWKVPKGLSPMQRFPDYIIRFLCMFHNDMGLYNRGRHMLMSQWSSTWVSRMNGMNIDVLRTVECTNLHVMLKESDIKSPKAGLGVFAEKSFRKGDIIGHYYGALVYADLGEKKKLSKRYGEGILAVSSSDFGKWAANIQYQFSDINGNQYSAWLSPAPWCVMRYINDGRYLPCDKASDAERQENPRKVNVKFKQTSTAVCNRDFENYTVMKIEAIKDIAVGEELYLDYGSDYPFEEV